MQRTTFLKSPLTTVWLLLSIDQLGAMAIFERAAGLFPALPKRALRAKLFAVDLAAPLEPWSRAGASRYAQASEQGGGGEQGKGFHK